MKQVIDIGLPPLKQPFSWAVKASGSMLFTAHGPVREDGSIDTGTIAEQARLTFANLRRAVHAANGTLADVTQVLIYMTEVGDMPVIDAVYREGTKSIEEIAATLKGGTKATMQELLDAVLFQPLSSKLDKPEKDTVKTVRESTDPITL